MKKFKPKPFDLKKKPEKTPQDYLHKLLFVMAILALGHFAYYLGRTEYIELNEWNNIACALKDSKELVSRDCLFTREKAQLFTAPYLAPGEKLSCRAPREGEEESIARALKSKLLNSNGSGDFSGPGANAQASEPSACNFWPTKQRSPDIGWDAYRIWYGRAFLMYKAIRLDGESYFKTLFSNQLENVFNSNYYQKYPWGLSFLYAHLMLLFQSPNPLFLTFFQMLTFLAFIFLLRATWPKAPLLLWVSAAFVPIAGRFFSHLYADIYLCVFILLGFLLLEKNKFVWALLAWSVLPWIKSEGWVHAVSCLWVASTLSLWEWRKQYLKSIVVVASVFLYLLWAAQFPLAKDFTPMGERIFDLKTYTERLPTILPYYLDVFFRPMLWGLWWPFVIFVFFYKARADILAWLALFSLWALIPLAFLPFDEGAYREVVLTGSNRALFQCLPLSWILLRRQSTFFTPPVPFLSPPPPK